MKFTIYGHKNLLSAHRNTIEFTKDKNLTKNGDCIVGVNSNFKVNEIKELLKFGKAEAIIKAGKYKDSFTFDVNPNFNDKHELVFRRSDFESSRTLGFKISKAAKDLNKNLIRYLQDPKHKVVVEIKPVITYIILDFDDTLAETSLAFRKVVHSLNEFGKKKYNKKGLGDAFDEAETEMVAKAKSEKNVKLYNRRHWADLALKRLNLPRTQKNIDEIFKKCWIVNLKEMKAMPHAKETIEKLYKSYKLFILTDGDGSVSLKKKKIKSTGLYKYFKGFSLGDALKTTKPDRRYYDYLIKNFKLNPKEGVMVGDRPPADLELAKKYGMMTIWIKHGKWLKKYGYMKFDYVDYTITDLRELLNILK